MFFLHRLKKYSNFSVGILSFIFILCFCCKFYRKKDDLGLSHNQQSFNADSLDSFHKPNQIKSNIESKKGSFMRRARSSYRNSFFTKKNISIKVSRPQKKYHFVNVKPFLLKESRPLLSLNQSLLSQKVNQANQLMLEQNLLNALAKIDENQIRASLGLTLQEAYALLSSWVQTDRFKEGYQRHLKKRFHMDRGRAIIKEVSERFLAEPSLTSLNDPNQIEDTSQICIQNPLTVPGQSEIEPDNKSSSTEFDYTEYDNWESRRQGLLASGSDIEDDRELSELEQDFQFGLNSIKALFDIPEEIELTEETLEKSDFYQMDIDDQMMHINSLQETLEVLEDMSKAPIDLLSSSSRFQYTEVKNWFENTLRFILEV